MILEWVAQRAAWQALTAAVRRTWNYVWRVHATQEALRGGDALLRDSLSGMVMSELKQLGARQWNVQGLTSTATWQWLEMPTTAAAFTTYLVAKWGANEPARDHAFAKLKGSYADITGEHPNLAAGPIFAVANAIYARLTANPKAFQRFQAALQAHVAAALLGPNGQTLNWSLAEQHGNLCAAASELLPGARQLWRVPDVVAPLSLEVRSENSADDPKPISVNELIGFISHNKNVVLVGEGGIGKTTLLLELARRLAQSTDTRAAVYVDAAAWAGTGLPLLEYVAGLGPTRARGLDVAALHRLAATYGMTVLLNGWNEISVAARYDALTQLRALVSMEQGINVVLTARDAQETGGLTSPLIVNVRGLRWQAMREVVRRSLTLDKSTALIERLARDERLRLVARNPLVLNGIIQLERAESESARSVFDILAAIVSQFEQEGQRVQALNGAPLLGMQQKYLERIALCMNRERGASISVEGARRAVNAAADWLIQQGDLAARPEPVVVVGALCDHHLLTLDGGIVRFAHQRFQEYYAASALLECVGGDRCTCGEQEVVLEGLNWPFWEDALKLASEKLAFDRTSARAKELILTAARQVDLDLVCRVAGWVRLERKEAPGLFDGIVADVNRFWAGGDEQAQEYALRCMVGSEFSIFCGTLWAQLEDANSQVRFALYRVREIGLAARQLGTDVVERASAWPEDRRREFVHEIAANPENLDVLRRFAGDGQPHSVRASAIEALSWNYPASGAAMAAWLQAPDEVKVDVGVLLALEVELMEQLDTAGEHLLRIADAATDEQQIFRLGTMFPNLLGNRAKAAILNALANLRYPKDGERVLAIAKAHFPDDLIQAAKALAVSGNMRPDWVRETVVSLPAAERHALFAECWRGLNEQAPGQCDFAAIGQCASASQTEEAVSAWLRLDAKRRGPQSEDQAVTAQYRAFSAILERVPGDDLLCAILKLGRSADYISSAAMVRLLLQRARPEARNRPDAPVWALSVEQIDELFGVFWDKAYEGPLPNVDLKVALCEVATICAPGRYLKQVLEATKLELDAWSAFDDYVSNVQGTAHVGRRPSNPLNGIVLSRVLTRCGFDILPGLLSLLSHPSAWRMGYEGVTGILCGPWNAGTEQREWAPSFYGAHAKMRRRSGRVLLQPDAAHQADTDNAVRQLAEALLTHLERFDVEASHHPQPTNPRFAPRSNGSLVVAIARCPSSLAKEVVFSVLQRGDIDAYSFIDSLYALVHQGAFLDDGGVARLLEAQCEALIEKPWLDQSESWQLNRIHQLLYFVRPGSLLTTRRADRLPVWRKRVPGFTAAHDLGTLYVPEAWESMGALARECVQNGNASQELLQALASGVDEDTFESFLSLVQDGTYLRLAQGGWDIDRAGAAVAKAVAERPDWRGALVATCLGSGEPLAASLACAVLKESDAGDAEIMNAAMAALARSEASDTFAAVSELLMAQFTLKLPHGGGSYSLYPRSSNALREKLYEVALGVGPKARLARSILLDLEALRREQGRPADEPWHPNADGRTPLDAVLLSTVADRA